MFKKCLVFGAFVFLAGCAHGVKDNYLPTPSYIAPEQYKQVETDMKTVPESSPAWKFLGDYFLLRYQLCAEKDLGNKCQKLQR